MTNRRLSQVALVCTLAALVGSSAEAQIERSVRAGDRVRVQALDGPVLIGDVEEVTRDTLLLVDEDYGTRRLVPVWTIVRLEVSAGQSTPESNMLRGAAAGLAVGALVGGALGAATCAGDSDGFGGSCNVGGKRAQFILGGALILGVPAAALGAVIGAASPLEQWRRVWPEVRAGLSVIGRRRIGFTIAANVGPIPGR
ncbi:MAG: hypothetical protein ABIV10_12565 [Gemmatimonadaceae bacterium]